MQERQRAPSTPSLHDREEMVAPRPILTPRRLTLPVMYERQSPRLRSDDTWAEVRRAWERGETGASLARRYDVGLANLWRRRASEGWERRREKDPAPEPLEGWDRYAERKRDEFELRVAEARAVAVKLAEAMQGAPLGLVPLWHMGFVLAWRAAHLTPETAARDREWVSRYGWAGEMWDATGRMMSAPWVDGVILHANRAAWREDAGLPDGVAEDYP